jgi:hypothetical protein
LAEPASTLARGLQFNEALPAKEDSTIYAQRRELLAGAALSR